MTKLNGHAAKVDDLPSVSIERVGMVTVACVRKHAFNPRLHDVGRLIDAMMLDGDPDVARWYEQLIFSSDRLTRSCFISAVFDYIREEQIVQLLDEAHEKNREELFAAIAKRRETGGTPIRATRPAKRR